MFYIRIADILYLEMVSEDPYLSIVIVSRNDNHGTGLLQRMQHSIDCLQEQCERYELETELIIVEWNPPADQPLLQQALLWPTSSKFLSVRIITVPPEVHKKFQNSEKLFLFQMIGKNVGIRRAKGKFILATNVDIIFSNELVNFLSKRQLEHNIVYRANRIDVDSNIPKNISLEEKLTFCRTHIIRTNLKYYILNFSNLETLVKEIIKSPFLIGYYFKNAMYKLKIPRMHYNACGDFILMAKEHWQTLYGYPELEIFSLHIDSLLLMATFYYGLKEQILYFPKEIYHLEHDSGIAPGTSQIMLFKKLKDSQIPFLIWRDVINFGQIYKENITKGKFPITSNDDSWGLRDIHLPERIVGD